MVLTDVAIGGLTKSMEALSRNIREAMDFADRAQRASLALGTTYEQTRVELGGTMEGLRGDINQRFRAGIAGLEAGLQGNTAGVAKLINQQQLTNTAFGKTATTFAQLESVLNLSRDETNRLSSSLVETGAEYQISTDKLVGAIDALKDTFPAQALAGMGDNVMAAVTQLQAELGPQLAGPLNNVMRMIMDTSMEGYANLIKLGIGDVRERLSAAKDQNETLRIFKDAFITAEGNFRSLAGDAKTFFPMIGVAQDTFGKQSIHLTTIVNNLGKRIKKEGADAADFGKTLRNLKNEIFVPFQEGLSIAYPYFLEVVDVVSAVMNTFGQRFKDFVDSLGEEGGAAAVLKDFKLAIVDFAIYGLGSMEGVFTFTKFLFTEYIPNAFGSLGDAFIGLTEPGGPIHKLKEAFYLLSIATTKTRGLFGNEEAKRAAKDAENKFHKLQYQEFLHDQGLGKRVPRFTEALKEAQELAFSENAKRSPMYQELKAIRDSIENNEPLLRKTNEELERLNETQDEVNKPSNTFLNQTSNLLTGSMERILGLDRNNTLQESIENLNDTIEANVEATANMTDEFSTGPSLGSSMLYLLNDRAFK